MSSALLPKTDIPAGPQGDGVHFRSNIPHDLASGSIPTPVSVTTEEQDYQYGGSLRCRCIFAASTHHIRSAAKRGNARSRAAPLSPVGTPSAARVCPMGPTAIVLETTTIPISDSVPCQAVAARAPDTRPAE